jgi:hypothetical protein
MLRDRYENYLSPCSTTTWTNDTCIEIIHGDIRNGEILLIPKVVLGQCKLFFRDTVSGSVDSVNVEIFILRTKAIRTGSTFSSGGRGAEVASVFNILGRHIGSAYSNKCSGIRLSEVILRNGEVGTVKIVSRL